MDMESIGAFVSVNVAMYAPSAITHDLLSRVILKGMVNKLPSVTLGMFLDAFNPFHSALDRHESKLAAMRQSLQVSRRELLGEV